jgi:hypothetical protein
MFLTSPYIEQAISLIEGFERNRDVTLTIQLWSESTFGS